MDDELNSRLKPLRERIDCAELIHKILLTEAGATTLETDSALIERLLRHSWPGNVRELRNVLRTMLALRSSDRLTLADFNEEWLASGGDTRPANDGESALSNAEREALRRTLEACEWNVSAAAARLHISRRTIYRKIHRHGLLRHVHNLGARTPESE